MNNVHVVYGSPLSGKTTWAKDRLKDGDILFDYDDVMQTMTGLPYQTHDSAMQSTVLDVRTQMIEANIKGTTYIITTFISKELERELVESSKRVSYTKMNTEYMTVMQRLHDSSRSNKEALKHTIIDWYHKYHVNPSIKGKYGTEVTKKKFYNSNEWYGSSGLRQQAMQRDNFECQLCKRKGYVKLDSIKEEGKNKLPALNVHHVMEIEHYPELALEIDNIVTVCIACHNRIHNKLEFTQRQQDNKWAHDETW